MLVLFSSMTFVTLNNATSNLNASYSKVVKNGNLHDFVINERFILGNSEYSYILNSGSYDPETKEYTFSVGPTINPENGKVKWTNSYEKIYNEYSLWKANGEQPHSVFSQNKNLFENTEYFISLEIAPTDLTDNEYINDVIFQNLDRLETITGNYVPTQYIKDIQSEAPVTLRRFNAIDVQTSNFFYKVIENDPNSDIDKIVLFEGNKISDYDVSFTNLFSTYAALTGDKANGIEMGHQIVKLLTETSWSGDGPPKYFNAFYDFIKEKPDTNPWSVRVPVTNFNARVGQSDFKLIINKGYYIEKGFSITFDVKKLFPFTGVIEDKSSYEAIVTPEYLSTHKKKIFPYNEWFANMKLSQNAFEEWFESISEEYKIKIDNINYIIIGSGISPDFMYPVISNERIIPNLNTEAIFYTNKSGFSKVHDSFRNSNIETMILGKFNPGISNQSAVLDKINFLSKSLMDWPNNMQAAFFADDLSNIITPTALRVTFIPNVMDLVTLVSLFLTSFIVVVSLIIMVLFIKRFIELNKVNLAIFQANGYKKSDIIIPMILSLSLLVFIGSMVGYFLGFILQIPAMGLFTNFWTLPLTLSSFNGVTFFIFVILLVGFYGLVALFIIVILLRGDNVNLMKDDARFKGNLLISSSKRVFKNTNPLNKFRISLAYHSLTKLLLLSVMTSLIMTSLVFASSTFQSFDNSINASFKQKKFKYDLKLFSPTNTSGQYYGVPINNIGMTLIEGRYVNPEGLTTEEILDENNTILTFNDLNTSYKSYQEINDPNNPTIKNPGIDLLNKNGNWHLPSIADLERQSMISFLKTLSQNKSLLDVSILGNNPWDIASRLMPINQKNYANDSFRKIFSDVTIDNGTYTNIININNSNVGTYSEDVKYSETLLKYTKNSTANDPNSFKNKIVNDTPEDDYLIIDPAKIINGNFIIDSEFFTFIMNLFDRYKISNQNYTINFHKVPLMTSDNELFDETYTNVEMRIEKINGSNVNLINKSDLKGMKDNSRFLSLTNKDDVDLLKLLAEYQNENPLPPNGVLPETTPILVNEFAANELNLKIGSILDIEILNHVDRFEKTISTSKLQVLGIVNTFQAKEFYTLQNYANLLTGMNRFIKTGNEANPLGQPFNSIMSNSDLLVQVNNTISSYSPSGIYIGNDRFSSSVFLDILSKPNNKYEYMKEAAAIVNYELPVNFANLATAKQFQEDLISKYGDSVYVSLLDNIVSIEAMKSLAHDMSSTSNIIQTSILSIIVLISSIIISLIVFMLIHDSSKIAGMIKILGLKNFSNAISFISIYFVAVFLGIIISIPLSILVNALYLNLIFSTTNILLIAPITIADYLIASSSLLIFFGITFAINWIKIRKLNLTKTIK
ncbi:MAG: ABC transporter permease [Mycoplasmoidaceae bacterium]